MLKLERYWEPIPHPCTLFQWISLCATYQCFIWCMVIKLKWDSYLNYAILNIQAWTYMSVQNLKYRLNKDNLHHYATCMCMHLPWYKPLISWYHKTCITIATIHWMYWLCHKTSKSIMLITKWQSSYVLIFWLAIRSDHGIITILVIRANSLNQLINGMVSNKN